MKIVLNKMYGAFTLSDKACDLLGIPYGTTGGYENNRTDPRLIKVVEQLGSEAGLRNLSLLKVIEIPDGIEYEILDYDGIETVVEKGHYWG